MSNSHVRSAKAMLRSRYQNLSRELREWAAQNSCRYQRH